MGTGITQRSRIRMVILNVQILGLVLSLMGFFFLSVLIQQYLYFFSSLLPAFILLIATRALFTIDLKIFPHHTTVFSYLSRWQSYVLLSPVFVCTYVATLLFQIGRQDFLAKIDQVLPTAQKIIIEITGNANLARIMDNIWLLVIVLMALFIVNVVLREIMDPEPRILEILYFYFTTFAIAFIELLCIYYIIFLPYQWLQILGFIFSVIGILTRFFPTVLEYFDVDIS